MKFESCAQCPENYTTPDSGSIAEANCSLLNCDPGYKISGESCIPCGFGFYNSKRHQTHCMACTTNTNTSTEIATNATDCQLYCQPGMSGTIRCEKCENGKIKPYAGLDACTDCLGNYTSNANRTKCDVLFCDKGFYYNATGPTCLPCDKGFYKDKRGNEPTCNKCAIGSTTAGIGTDDSTKCNQTFCIEGKYYNASSPEKCLPCLVGTYKDFVGNNETCLTCGINLTTTDKGAKAQSECSIIVCEAGQRRTGSKTCVDCEPGFYQPERGKTVCKSCEGGKITLNSRSKSIDDCVPLCKAGEEYVAATKNCSLCSFGYFKKEVGNNVGCTKCPQALKTTKTEGSISSKQCTEDICGAGTKRVSNQGCVPCPRGEYQEEQDKTSCKPCGSNYTTVNTGTITNEDCILDCPDGQSYSYSTRTCRNCDNGWYTDKNRYCCKCIQCPDGMQRTAYAGSNICIPSTSTSTMQPQRGKRVLMINYTFQIRLNCENADVIRSFKDLLINIIIRRLVSLRLTYTALCKNPSCTDRKSNLRITSVNCGGRSYIISKKRSTEETVKFDVEIPEVEETVKDNAGTGVKTTDLLVEDFNANKNLYKQENVTEFKPTEISQGEFVKFCDAGDVLDTTSNTCKPCPKGTYFESSLMRCIGCQQNKYQDKEAQLTCKNCTGIKKYTINVNSTSVSSCVTECEINRGYCQNGGTCNSDEYSVSCSCTDRYGGDHCQSFKEPVGNTMAIVGGAIGGGAALLIIVLLIVGICAYYRSPRDAYYKRDEGRVYEYDEDVYRNPLFNNRFNMFPPQLNQSFVMDDYSGDDAVYNPYSKNPGRPTGIDEDHSEFRWKPTS
ncbi:hypothetical protein KUTeg_003422 [Tegillarca granosa]|uniref:EGF-like domain-containing protein n=1 Tax=Tegillarca granosa TaxID=220873 RepID=A0ABQ9FNQ3_TEGGR|nr:hypothetical protein KUTeg_003422 [Tegillarca granosa]